jgi:HSP20 family protein
MPADTTHRPFVNFSEIRERFERFMAERGPRRHTGEQSVPVDMQRSDQAMRIVADVPGMKPEEISITVEGNLLTVSGHHEESVEEDMGGYMRRERRYGAFRRSMPLPPEADPEHIRATTKDGVLEVVIPESAQLAERKRIQITPTGS